MPLFTIKNPLCNQLNFINFIGKIQTILDKLSPSERPICPKVSFEQGIKKIAEDLRLDCDRLKNYILEDDIGGYPDKWESGSIWEIEAQLLYALTRILRPAIIVEFGTFRGCSTEHFLKALDANRKGKIYTVDIIEVRNKKVRDHPRACVIKEDGIIFSKKINFEVDIIFEDGPHSTKFTQNVIKNCLPHLASKGLLLIHDVCHPDVSKKVTKGLERVIGDFHKVLIEPSDSGLGYWRKDK